MREESCQTIESLRNISDSSATFRFLFNYFSSSSSLQDTNNGSEYESACHVDGVVCPKHDSDARNDARQATLSAQVRVRTLCGKFRVRISLLVLGVSLLERF